MGENKERYLTKKQSFSEKYYYFFVRYLSSFLDLRRTLQLKDKSTVEILQNFVAFSEYINFKNLGSNESFSNFNKKPSK